MIQETTTQALCETNETVIEIKDLYKTFGTNEVKRSHFSKKGKFSGFR
jgi:hypothetical protein